MAEIRLHIITDDIAQASIDTFYRDPEFAPRWARFVTDIRGVVAIPAGSVCFGVFYSRKSAVEWAWAERRDLGDLVVGLTEQQEERLAAWRTRVQYAVLMPPAQNELPTNLVGGLETPDPVVIAQRWV